MSTPRSSPSAEGRFDHAEDHRCLRGLRHVYTLRAPLDLGSLRARLQAELGGAMLTGEETWGTVTVTRMLLQFRFEVRVGERPGVVVLLHRACSRPEDRRADRGMFEAALAGAVGAGP